MYTVQFKDYREKEYETMFGTCDLCYYEGTAIDPIFTFTAINQETGERTDIEVSGDEWVWGDQFAVTLADVISFAEWFDAQKITVEETNEVDFYNIRRWVARWEDECYDDIFDDEEDEDNFPYMDDDEYEFEEKE